MKSSSRKGSERFLEPALAGIWILAGLGKLVSPDVGAIHDLASSFGIGGGVLEVVYVLLALGEIGIALGLLFGRHKRIAARLGFLMAGTAGILWSASGQFRRSCGCFGSLGPGPWVRLAVIVALFLGSFVVLWARAETGVPRGLAS